MKTLFYKVGLFIIFIACYVNVYAQSDSIKIDSLKKVLAMEKEDTNKVNTLNELVNFYGREYDTANYLKTVNQALNISKKIFYKRGQGIALMYIGSYECEVLVQYDEAIKSLDLALKNFKEINDNINIALSYEILGGIYQYTGNKAESLQDYYAELKIYEKLKDKNHIAGCLSKIGFTNYYGEDYPQSLVAFIAALNKFKEIKTEEGSEDCYIYIANIYNIQKKYKEALDYDSIGLKISIKENNQREIARAYACMGDIFFQQIDLDKSSENNYQQTRCVSEALKNYDQSLSNYRDVDDGGGMGDNYERIAEINIRLHKFWEAKKYADSALLIARQVKDKDNLEKSYKILAKVDSIQGNYKQAYNHYKLYVLYRDSIINEKGIKKSLQTSMQYEFEKKEAVTKAEQSKKDEEARRIKNQQYFAIAALGIVVLAVVIIALIQFRNNKHKQKANFALQQQKEKVESTLTELKSTQAQLIQSEKMASLGELTAGIAHEIQNPLNFVNNFSEVNKEMIDEATEEIDKGNIDEVKNILNNIKDNSEKINHHGKRADAIVKGMLQHSRKSEGVKEPTDINALCDEYLRLSYHGLRAKDKSFNADFKTDFDETIEKINIVSQDIGRVLLNLINNAFYAVNEKLTAHRSLLTVSYKPLVSIQTKKLNDKIEIIVSDNGNGIPQNLIDKIFQPFFTTKPTGQGTGLGLSLAYDIITKEHNGTIKVESKEGEGSEFIIELPIA